MSHAVLTWYALRWLHGVPCELRSRDMLQGGTALAEGGVAHRVVLRSTPCRAWASPPCRCGRGVQISVQMWQHRGQSNIVVECYDSPRSGFAEHVVSVGRGLEPRTCTRITGVHVRVVQLGLPAERGPRCRLCCNGLRQVSTSAVVVSGVRRLTGQVGSWAWAQLHSGNTPA